MDAIASEDMGRAKTRKNTRGRSGKGGGKRRLQGEKALIAALPEALSDEEIERVLVHSLLALDGPGRKRLYESLGPETGGTLRGLLENRRAKPRKGRDKVRQDWEREWESWWEIVSESSYEEGRYIVQDHHWEPPYLDVSAVQMDLEKVAARMRKLLPRVFEDGLDADLDFADFFKDTAEEVGSGLDDWMTSPDGMHYGPQSTWCLLDWQRRAAVRDGERAFFLADRICRLEHSMQEASLDEGTVIKLFLELGKKDQRDVLAGIAGSGEEHWKRALSDVNTAWFDVHMELARRWDSERFVEQSRANIDQDWRLALPLVTALLRKKDHESAMELVLQAMQVLLRLKPDQTWDPRQKLIVGTLRPWLLKRDSAAVNRLLSQWRRAASGLGQGEIAGALQLQQTACKHWWDWATMIDAFRQARVSGFEDVCDALFTEWRSLIAEVTVHKVGEHSWLPALADAAYTGEEGAFRIAVHEWLDGLERDEEGLDASLRALGLLTMDLDSRNRLKRSFPSLMKILSWRCDEDNPMRKSRREMLQRMHLDGLFDEVMDFWKRNAERLVPDPAKATGSNYDHCAQWAAAVRELDPASYERIVRSWSDTHKRRRNLWKALRDSGLPPVA